MLLVAGRTTTGLSGDGDGDGGRLLGLTVALVVALSERCSLLPRYRLYDP